MLLIDNQCHATRHESYRRVAQRIESIAGVQQAAQWRCDFDPATQEVAIHSLIVRRRENAREHASPERLRFFQREENLERYTLDGFATVMVLLEDVRIGDVIDTSFTIRTTARIFPEHFSLLTAVPVAHGARLFHLSVQFSTGHAMRWNTDSRMIEVEKNELENGETRWSWKVENFAPRETEPNVPGWFFPGRFIQVTDFPSWQTVAAGLASAWEENFDHAELVEMAGKIAALSGIHQQVESALRLVQDEVRYLSVNTELGGAVPSAAGVVLQRRFGDCKDKAFLLVHLLRRLGVSARPVLVHTMFRHRVEQFLPMPGAFNHAIVEYELGGQRRWVDATIPLQGGGPMGRALPPFGKGLPVEPEAVDLEPIASADGVDGIYRVHESFRFESRRLPMILATATTTTGAYADDVRRQMTFEGTTAIGKGREQFYQRLFPGAARHAELEWRDDRERNEVILADAYVLPENFTTRVEPGIGGFFAAAHVIRSAIGFQDMEERRHPLGVPFPCHVEHVLECEFEAIGTGAARFPALKTDAFTFHASGPSVTGGRTVFQLTLKTNTDHVSPENFVQHRAKVLSAWGTTGMTIHYRSERRFKGSRGVGASLMPPPRETAIETSINAGVSESASLGEIAQCLHSRTPGEPMAPAAAACKIEPESSGPRRVGRSGVSRGDADDFKAISRYAGIGVVIVIVLVRTLMSIFSH